MFVETQSAYATAKYTSCIWPVDYLPRHAAIPEALRDAPPNRGGHHVQSLAESAYMYI